MKRFGSLNWTISVIFTCSCAQAAVEMPGSASTAPQQVEGRIELVGQPNLVNLQARRGEDGVWRLQWRTEPTWGAPMQDVRRLAVEIWLAVEDLPLDDSDRDGFATAAVQGYMDEILRLSCDEPATPLRSGAELGKVLTDLVAQGDKLEDGRELALDPLRLGRKLVTRKWKPLDVLMLADRAGRLLAQNHAQAPAVAGGRGLDVVAATVVARGASLLPETVQAARREGLARREAHQRAADLVQTQAPVMAVR